MRLRVIDFGFVSPLRSQACYHGLAEIMRATDDPILALSSPDSPYISIGMHQDAWLELDLDWCRQQDLPVIRRQVGGGTVYLDREQLFYHFIFPQKRAPRSPDQLYPHFIAPVAAAYAALGLDARLHPPNDIHIGQAKIGGTGAATINEATVMVGSFLFDFDLATMTRCLRVPSTDFRRQLHQALAANMTTLKQLLPRLPTRETLKRIFLAQVERSLKLRTVLTVPSAAELCAIGEQEVELADPEWTLLEGRRVVADGVKISADTFLLERGFEAGDGPDRVRLLEKGAKLSALHLDWPTVDAAVLQAIDQALHSCPLEKSALSRGLQRFNGLSPCQRQALLDALVACCRHES